MENKEPVNIKTEKDRTVEAAQNAAEVESDKPNKSEHTTMNGREYYFAPVHCQGNG